MFSLFDLFHLSGLIDGGEKIVQEFDRIRDMIIRDMGVAGIGTKAREDNGGE